MVTITITIALLLLPAVLGHFFEVHEPYTLSYRLIRRGNQQWWGRRYLDGWLIQGTAYVVLSIAVSMALAIGRNL